MFVSVKRLADKIVQKAKTTVDFSHLFHSSLFPSREAECRPGKLSPNLVIQHSRRAGLGQARKGWGRRQVYIKKNALISLFA